jgi:hypothetical protein
LSRFWFGILDRGSFDWAGIMPTEIITVNNIKYLYYIGWSLRVDVPYHNNLGLAISHDNGNTWEKYSKGPVLSTSHLEPGYIGTVSILIENNIWRMWYLSCLDWVESDLGMEPTYDIKYAESEDGIIWKPLRVTCIPLDDDVGGISSQRVLKINDEYHMWYSIRNKLDYRKNTKNSYRIKKSTSKDGINWKRTGVVCIDYKNKKEYAIARPSVIKIRDEYHMWYSYKEHEKEYNIGYAISKNGLDWKRIDKCFGLEKGKKGSWDSKMLAYPHVFLFKNNLFLLYNGNEYGRTGIGLAKLDQKII